MTDTKPGLYLCKGCGIGEAVDVDELETLATGEHNVSHCRQHDILCSMDGVQQIQQDIADGTVNQVIVGACSRRVMTDRFHFPGAHVVRADLREQVTWTHPAGDEDTQMLAADNIRMGITEAKNSTLPEPWQEGDFSDRILVVGGGLSGLTAAIEASRAGHPVLLVERGDSLGGWSAKWSARMPHRPPYRGPQPNGMDALVAEVEADGNISVQTNATVAKTEGMPGKFSVTVLVGGTPTSEIVGAVVVATGWRPYDANKLGHLGYGASPDVVTGVELEGMLANGGIKRPSDDVAPKLIAFVQCAGSRDPDHLPYCSSVCCGVSIKQALQIRRADPETSVYVIYEEMRTPGTAEEFYREAQEAGVIFMKGKVKSVAGDLTVTVDDELLGEEVPMSGLDMVVLATGMVPNSTNPDAPEFEDGADQLVDDINPLAPIPFAGSELPAASELTASPATAGGPLLNLDYRQGPHIPMLADGFSDSHFICFPYETRRTGIYTCGPVRRPMDMAESAEDAAGAVMKAVQAVRNARDGAAAHPRAGDLSYPKINLDICTKCRRCTVECPFGAIEEDERDYPIVNPTRCRRCGTCMGACPVRTISFDNYNVQMVTEMIQSVEVPDEFDEKPRVLILACENDALPALDMAGINRNEYSPYVRTIPVRCLGSVSLVWISEALSAGYDGVMLMGCKSGDDYQCHFVKGSAIAKERMSKIGDTLQKMMLEEDRIVQEEVSIADSHRVPELIDKFMEKIDEIGMNPFKGF
jgi:quinone-modifying oxidoreductase, subunit QmoB